MLKKVNDNARENMVVWHPMLGRGAILSISKPNYVKVMWEGTPCYATEVETNIIYFDAHNEPKVQKRKSFSYMVSYVAHKTINEAYCALDRVDRLCNRILKDYSTVSMKGL